MPNERLNFCASLLATSLPVPVRGRFLHTHSAPASAKYGVFAFLKLSVSYRAAFGIMRPQPSTAKETEWLVDG
jgi:hypothetical protein